MKAVQRGVQDTDEPEQRERAGPRVRSQLSMEGRAARGVATACLASLHTVGAARARRGEAVNTPGKGGSPSADFYQPPTGTRTVSAVARRGLGLFTKKLDELGATKALSIALRIGRFR